eukprot:323293-Chlamydomonas_euryale.AAC.1
MAGMWLHTSSNSVTNCRQYVLSHPLGNTSKLIWPPMENASPKSANFSRSAATMALRTPAVSSCGRWGRHSVAQQGRQCEHNVGERAGRPERGSSAACGCGQRGAHQGTSQHSHAPVRIFAHHRPGFASMLNLVNAV